MQYLQMAEAAGVAGCAALAALIAAAAKRAHTLTAGGALAAFVVGTVIFACGGLEGAAALLTFFVASNLLGRWRRRRKEALGFEKGGERDPAQVLANSLTACVLVAASAAARGAHHEAIAATLHAGFAAAIAGANADTWATEVGAASSEAPRLITTLERVAPGRSGAVSVTGLAAALAGSALIALCCWAFDHATRAPLIVTVAGFLGAVADSFFGATIQALYLSPAGDVTERRPNPEAKPISGFAGVGNDLVNLLSTVAAAVIAVIGLSALTFVMNARP